MNVFTRVPTPSKHKGFPAESVININNNIHVLFFHALVAAQLLEADPFFDLPGAQHPILACAQHVRAPEKLQTRNGPCRKNVSTGKKLGAGKRQCGARWGEHKNEHDAVSTCLGAA